ncbi:conserved virulence factor C family protein [Bacillus solimangrovi]|uniref:Virulence factor n=1 Tax=Bacillus solimangrovi TaxID=1305675 RepID=A0A1E5LFH2_9BACI|nr:virulence factor [Bacillus solimangrovi]OEH92838.1 virulence factor [Bacillus solimangrovi]
MKIKSIEPTPSPNTMKIILDTILSPGERNHYKKEHSDNAPHFIQELLRIEGVTSVYHVSDFVALDRHPKFDWKQLLKSVRKVFGDEIETSGDEATFNESFGDVKVFVQIFAGIPMQIKLTDGELETRQGLPERFMEAIMTLTKQADNIVMEREWKEYGIRYGDMNEIGEEVADEIEAAYDIDRLSNLVRLALLPKEKIAVESNKTTYQVTFEMMEHADWKKRYAALEQMNPKKEDLPILEKALDDEKQSIRRLAVVYLGMIEDADVLPLLEKAMLTDKSAMVRRTAGDGFSDLGDVRGIPAAMKALEDKNKLVRWRAAMFLYEVGDKQAIPALKKATSDLEFEVALQVQMAIERIEGGVEAKGSVWKQMTESISKNPS